MTKEMSSNRWPDLPEGLKDDPRLEFKKLLYQAQLQVVTTRQLADIEIAKEDFKANKAYEHVRRQALYTAYLDLAKEQLERMQARAEFVEKAASVIGGAYGVILGLAFNINKDISRIPPTRGLAPLFFLGLSLTLAAIYLAYITSPRVTPSSSRRPSTLDVDAERLRFIELTTNIVLQRIRWLQSAVISLGFGVLSLPVAFLNIQDNLVEDTVAVVVSLLIIFLPSIIIPSGTALLLAAQSIYWRFKFRNVWPKTSQDAAKLFGGTPDRWELLDEGQWKLKDGSATKVDTHSLLAGGYNDQPVTECYAWVGTQTVTTASIYRDLPPSRYASRVADLLTDDQQLNPEHVQCTIRLK